MPAYASGTPSRKSQVSTTAKSASATGTASKITTRLMSFANAASGALSLAKTRLMSFLFTAKAKGKS